MKKTGEKNKKKKIIILVAAIALVLAAIAYIIGYKISFNRSYGESMSEFYNSEIDKEQIKKLDDLSWVKEWDDIRKIYFFSAFRNMDSKAQQSKMEEAVSQLQERLGFESYVVELQKKPASVAVVYPDKGTWVYTLENMDTDVN